MPGLERDPPQAPAPPHAASQRTSRRYVAPIPCQTPSSRSAPSAHARPSHQRIAAVTPNPRKDWTTASVHADNQARTSLSCSSAGASPLPGSGQRLVCRRAVTTVIRLPSDAEPCPDLGGAAPDRLPAILSDCASMRTRSAHLRWPGWFIADDQLHPVRPPPFHRRRLTDCDRRKPGGPRRAAWGRCCRRGAATAQKALTKLRDPLRPERTWSPRRPSMLWRERSWRTAIPFS